MTNWKHTLDLIKADYSRLSKRGHMWIIARVFLNYSFCITFWFRIASYLSERKGILPRMLLLMVKAIYLFNQRSTGIQLPIGTKIDAGLTFLHYSCIVIAYSVTIGKNCSIHQGVTIGRVFGGSKAGVPSIGDNVVIFAGAKVVGNVRIGNNVVIGANAVVVDDVPSGCVVAGIPAKIVSHDSSKCFEGQHKEKYRF